MSTPLSPELKALSDLLDAYDNEHGTFCLCGEEGYEGPCPPCVARVQLGRSRLPKHQKIDTPAIMRRFDGLVDWLKVPQVRT